MSDWQPPKPEADKYGPGAERAPWGRYILTALFIGAIALGGLWLASKVVIPDEVPNA